MAVECTTGYARNLLTIDHCIPIVNQSEGSPHQRDVVGMPHVRCAWHRRLRCEESVNRTHAPVRSFRGRVGFDLHLVAASKKNAAIGLGPGVEFNVQLKIPEFGGGNELRALPILRHRAVLDAPDTSMTRIGRLPTGKVLAVEQRDWFAPLKRPLRFKGRRSLARPWPGNTLGTCRGARKPAPRQLSLEQCALIETYVCGRGEFDFPVLDLNL